MQEENGWGSNSQEKKALAREPEMKLRLERDRPPRAIPPRARLEKLCFPPARTYVALSREVRK